MQIVCSLRLECTSAVSNKFYNLDVKSRDDADSFAVYGRYGRLGDPIGFVTKIAGFDRSLTEREAELAMRAFANKKIAKGYTVVMGEMPPAKSAWPFIYACEFIPGKGGYRAAKSALLALAKTNSAVAQGLEALKAPKKLTGDAFSPGQPAFAVALSLAMSGNMTMWVAGEPMARADMREMVRGLKATQSSLLEALGLIDASIDNYATAIGIRASALVL